MQKMQTSIINHQDPSIVYTFQHFAARSKMPLEHSAMDDRNQG